MNDGDRMGRAHSRVSNARNDMLAGAVVIAAILLFIGNGSQTMTDLLGRFQGLGGDVNSVLSVALVLNVALILFGWRRYDDLRKEIVERTAAEKDAQLLAERDPLTGFYNRRALADHGAQMLERAVRRETPVAMLMLDLDHFKNVNDVHGHAVGDALLKAVADEVATLLPASAVAARLGGDEFACAFPFEASDQAGVDRVARAIVARLAQPFAAAHTHAHVSGSVGIAQTGADCQTIDALMRRADIAMYAAKQGGRNRYAWFDVTMERELQLRNEIEADLRSGIPRGEIVPFFEQQIDLATGQLVGFEVLARWCHPSRGLLVPESFLSIAEESGLIGDLSLSVMRQAFLEARHWDPSLQISVNVAPGQLKDPWFAQKIVKLLAETGFPATRLEVEITETSLFENLLLAQSIAASLKNQGIRLSLDDFGTGYSSLAHLRALPFDSIKIDRSFVRAVAEDPESAAIVSAVARLGQSLALPVTAEGVESADVEARLRALGCQRVQGFLYGRPVPAGEARSLIAPRSARTASSHASDLDILLRAV